MSMNDYLIMFEQLYAKTKDDVLGNKVLDSTNLLIEQMKELKYDEMLTPWNGDSSEKIVCRLSNFNCSHKSTSICTERRNFVYGQQDTASEVC